MDKQPSISVGIVSARELTVTLEGSYNFGEPPITTEGTMHFAITDQGKISFMGTTFDSLTFTPAVDIPFVTYYDGTPDLKDLAAQQEHSFEVKDVVIGVNFHWERRENQRFRGSFKIIVEGDKLTLINILPVEEYLKSVISSEMSATANEEFLKAHAVISRSWLLAQINKNKKLSHSRQEHFCSCTVTDDEIVRWYDREDHVNFDVCADDHCQRYQGITRQTTPTVFSAVEATRGLVLIDNDGELCDARFSKCCGGVFEEFENCWEPRHFHYLEARRDGADAMDFPDLRIEENARLWILSRPEAYCNTSDAAILGQVLNNYDQETTDFYRWRVEYSQAELSALILERTGIDFGGIRALVPVERGTSGRLVKLRIEGTKRTMTIGKELEIRRSLSKSHLYSSAFVVDTEGCDAQGLPAKFIIDGAGWGHGVGLCQIGAAMMSSQGKKYDEILAHYFPGSKLDTLY